MLKCEIGDFDGKTSTYGVVPLPLFMVSFLSASGRASFALLSCLAVSLVFGGGMGAKQAG